MVKPLTDNELDEFLRDVHNEDIFDQELAATIIKLQNRIKELESTVENTV